MDEKKVIQFCLNLIIISGVLLISDATPILHRPQDVATVEGEEFGIRCGLDTIPGDIEGVRISKGNSWDDYKTIYQSLPEDWEENKMDKVKYGLIKHGHNDVTIIVRNVVFTDGGTYICEPMVFPSEKPHASVVVLGTPLVTLPPNILAGEIVNITCDAEFMGPQDLIDGDLFPDLFFKLLDTRFDGKVTHKPGASERLPSTLSLVFETAFLESNNGEDLYCIASIAKPPLETNISENLDIKYVVTDPQVPNKERYKIGEVIQCVAHGNPEPKITWEAVKSNIGGTFPNNLTIVEEMIGPDPEQWKCVAFNTPKEFPVIKSVSITFWVEPK